MFGRKAKRERLKWGTFYAIRYGQAVRETAAATESEFDAAAEYEAEYRRKLLAWIERNA